MVRSLVCGNTMCVSLCQVDFVLRELSFFILLPRSRIIGCSGDFSILKRTVLLFNYYPGGRYRKLAGTTTYSSYLIDCITALPQSQFLNWSQSFDYLALVISRRVDA